MIFVDLSFAGTPAQNSAFLADVVVQQHQSYLKDLLEPQFFFIDQVCHTCVLCCRDSKTQEVPVELQSQRLFLKGSGGSNGFVLFEKYQGLIRLQMERPKQQLQDRTLFLA